MSASGRTLQEDDGGASGRWLIDYELLHNKMINFI
jgi:hypothetical protein